MALRCFVETLRGESIALPEREARHARLSRRLSVGDDVVLFDGKGKEAVCTIAMATNTRVEVRVGEVITQLRPTPALTIAVALPKGPRQDTMIEKCTELGVARVQPLLTERSVASASEHKLDKWRQTTIEAAKQSGQCWLPELSAPKTLEEAAQAIGGAGLALVATVGGQADSTPIRVLLDRLGTMDTIITFIGPEGGWTDAEIELLTRAGARCVELGPNVLRIETAAIAVAAICHAMMREPDGR